jgi:hypothetical protein
MSGRSGAILGDKGKHVGKLGLPQILFVSITTKGSTLDMTSACEKFGLLDTDLRSFC